MRLGESSGNSFHKCFGVVAMCQALCSTWGQCKRKKKRKIGKTSSQLAHRTWFDLWHMLNKTSKKQHRDKKMLIVLGTKNSNTWSAWLRTNFH